MSPDQLRDIKNSYDDLCTLKLKMESVLQALTKMEVLDNRLRSKITSTTTMEELEYIVSTYVIIVVSEMARDNTKLLNGGKVA